MKLAIAILFLAPCAFAINVEKLADAIRKSEGVWTYGVNVPVRNETEARRVCIRTIRHAQKRIHGEHRHFIRAFADIYCPPKSDFIGNQNWKNNVIWFYEHN